MNIQFLTNGNLEMSATKKERQAIKQLEEIQSIAAEGTFIEKFLKPIGYEQILPVNCGALTSATLITNGKDIWGDMSYQIQSFLENLANGKSVIWTKG